MNETGNSGRSVTVALPDILERLRGRVHDSHMDAERLMDDAGDEIERIRAMPDWQPIATAPRVGVFLVYLPKEHRKFEVMYRSENATIVGGAFGFDRTSPTHWQPLPPPPEAQP